jgi:hypothetical protein
LQVVAQVVVTDPVIVLLAVAGLVVTYQAQDIQ